MQYGGYDVYKIYLGVKLHFTTSSYDYIKYNGKNNATLESFTKRKDRYFFHKLSKRYNERDILDYFVSNFAIDGRKWIGNLIRNDGNEAYINYRKYKETFDYSLREDLGRMLSDFEFKRLSFDDGMGVHNGQHSRFLRLLIQRKVSLQTAILLDELIAFRKNYDKEISETVVWPKISETMVKLRPFIKLDRTTAKFTIKEVING